MAILVVLSAKSHKIKSGFFNSFRQIKLIMLLRKKTLSILAVYFFINGCTSAQPLLHEAVLTRDKQKVIELIKQGSDINITNSKGKTALMEAIIFCNHPDFKEMVKLLLASGADVNIEAPGRVTALSIAVTFGYEDIIGLLLEYKADTNKQTPGCGRNRTVLMEVARSQSPNAVLSANVAELLIAHGADLNITDDDGKTALDYAISNNRKDLEAVFRRYGAK